MKFIFYFVLLRWLIRITFCAQQDPIERLIVSIEGDFSNLLDAVDEGVDEAADKLDDLGEKGEGAGKRTAKGAALAGAAFGLAATGAAKLLDMVTRMVVAIPQMFTQLGREAVAANAQFETFATQFETLLGTGSAAQSRLEELARFGVETPFELPEIVEASRTLQTFGGDILATGDNLRMIGDIAAGVNQPFQGVAFWIGRLYDALQNGQPFGEASARLQEMGALTGGARRQLEQMQKSGEDTTKMWSFFTEQVGGRFTGNMERLSGTFQGVMSNLADFRGELLRVGGQPLFEEIRDSAIEFLDLLNENSDLITEIAKNFGEFAANVIRLAKEGFGDLDIKPALEQLKELSKWLNDVIKAYEVLSIFTGKTNEELEENAEAAEKSWLSYVPFVAGIQALVEGFGQLDDVMLIHANILAIARAHWAGFLALLSPIGEALSNIGKAMIAVVHGQFGPASEFADKALGAIEDGLFDVEGRLEAMTESARESAKAMEEVLDPAEALKEGTDGPPPSKPEDIGLPSEETIGQIADKYTNQLIDATERRNEQLAEIEEAHGERVAKIMADANEKRLAIQGRFDEDMADLAQDSEDRRLEVIADTRQALAELQKNTDQQLADRRKDQNRQEMRETEDHLRSMRRLEEDFLNNLEDAVRARDAGAIVDLQRRFNQEQSQREEDFQVRQGRQGEDFDQELEEIRQNETERRNELLAAQEQELADIRAHEEERRAEIEQRRIEDMETLQANLNDQLAREDQNFSDRQLALDEALQSQLEAIAKGLADEKGVTEEGARQILDTFNEYFGIGGNIDQLMENFARRRKIRADIQVTFQSTGAPPSDVQGVAGRQGGIPEFAEGGTMLATKPTLAMFGEAGPELAQFIPLKDLNQSGSESFGRDQRMTIEMTGSAPPGIGTGERDQIAGVLLAALHETGALSR